MRVARTFVMIAFASAIAAVLLVPAARADEYTKQTYLTFSGPVQIPGVTLPAGTYMFKLADPESGRRAIQVWDEEGKKLFTTLLTIPDQIPEPQDDPVVLFSERPSGTPQAIKSWFYPAERSGYEFIYPKDQAMKIAAATGEPVLSYTGDMKAGADEAAMRGTEVGRIDAQGQAVADSQAAPSATATTTTAANRDDAPQSAPAADADAAVAPSSSQAPSANRSGQAESTTPQAQPSAEQSTSSPSATTASTATRSTTGASGAVGTSGQAVPSAQRSDTADADRRRQAASGTQADALPATASPLATIELMSLLMIVSALGVRQLRRRYAPNR